jgi:hypothetical protein
MNTAKIKYLPYEIYGAETLGKGGWPKFALPYQ